MLEINLQIIILRAKIKIDYGSEVIKTGCRETFQRKQNNISKSYISIIYFLNIRI